MHTLFKVNVLKYKIKKNTNALNIGDNKIGSSELTLRVLAVTIITNILYVIYKEKLI